MSNTWLDNSLKSTVSEYPLTVNMLKCPKHLWNLHGSSFIIFFHHAEGKGFRKYLPDLSLKSKACLLTHGLLITSIFFQDVRIRRSIFKCYYLKNPEHLLRFLFHLWNLHQILNIFKRNKMVIANLFPQLTSV